MGGTALATKVRPHAKLSANQMIREERRVHTPEELMDAVAQLEVCRQAAIRNVMQAEAILREIAPQNIYEEARDRWFNKIMERLGVDGFGGLDWDLKASIKDLAKLIPDETSHTVF